MTNNNKETIHWEESTKHRDEYKKKNTIVSKTIEKGLIGVNLAIKLYNNSIGLIPGVKKVNELNVKQTAEELVASGGGASLSLGLVDDALKLGRWGLSKAPSLSKYLVIPAEKALLAAEFAIDHLKDLMTSSAISGLAAEVGDLKDGQAKLNAKVDAQGKLMNKRMGDLKSELQGELKQQGEKFDKEIKELDKKLEQATGENKRAIEEERKQRQAQYQQIQNQIQEVTQNLNRVQTQLTNALNDFKSEVNERFEQQERKIIANKKRIEEERRQREAEVQEIKSKIKIGEQKAENLQQQLDENEDKFDKYKSQIDQKTAQTQQAFEDTQAEYQRKTAIIEEQIKDNEEIINEFQEDLTNVRNEQAKQRIQQEEILEELQETNDILFAQQRKLNLVADQMNDIQEEVHERMDKLSEQLDERINETLNVVQDTNKKLDKLTDEVQNIREETERLQEQVKQNKLETEKAKKEAKLANERLDNLIKAQSLADYSAQESKIDKIQKSLELKAEEAKLLATLNLLTETKKLIPQEPAEREWKVGIEKGTAPKDLPEPEGFTLTLNNYWERKYTGDQIKEDNPHSLFTQEWFNWEEINKLSPEQTKFEPWGERIKGKHETAPLTDPEKRKEQQVEKSQQEESKASGEETKQAEVLEELENLKTETLQQLATIQQQISQQLDQAEEEPIITKTKLSAKYAKPIQKAQKKVQQLEQSLASKKTATQQSVQKALTNPTPQNKKEIQQSQSEEKQAQKQLEQAQSELQNLEKSQDFEQELEKQEKEIRETQKTELEQTWTTIQALSQQSLQEQKDQPKPEPTKEEDLNKKLEELVQQLREMEQSAAASQKTMTMFMLYLIIFLLEYVVYKRNGLPGLVILNVILAVCYYHRETLKEYSELWGKYLLIIGYIMGNVLAYSAPEQEKYKWPSVIGFNLIIFGIYAYTLWQKSQAQAKIESHYQHQSQEICQENKVKQEEWANIQQGSIKSGIVDEYNVFSSYGNEIRTEQLTNLKTVIQQKEETQHQEEYLKKQAQTLEQAAEIEKKLTEARNSLGASSMSWNKIYEKYPTFKDKSLLLKEFEKVDRYLQQAEKETNKNLTAKLSKLPDPTEEELNLLSQLSLTVEQFASLASQAQYLTKSEREKVLENFPSFSQDTKLQLINSGLNNLEINTYQKKQSFIQLNQQLHNEKQAFGLSTSEKENILRLLITSLDLTTEQRTSLENMGIRFFDASNWEVSNEQANSLLSFGCQKIQLTEEQQTNLLNTEQLRTFTLTPQQKGILTSLAPLTRADKYSSQSLQLLRSLNFKPTTLTFLTNEEILPNPNLDFGEVKSPYLPLKTKFLEGEQKVLEQKQRQEEKKLNQQEIADKKWETLDSLTNWYQEQDEEEFNLTLSDFVKTGAIKEWQKDILLTLGLKTVPKYNFFELLIFAVENLVNTPFTDWLQEEENNWVAEYYQNWLARRKNQPITINKTIWAKFVSSQSSQQKELLNNLNLEELINQQIKKHLSNYQFSHKEEQFFASIKEVAETEENKPTSSTSRYDNLFANLSQEEAERQRKKLEREEARKKLEDQERQRREAKLSEKDKKLKEDQERRQKEKELQEQEAEKKRQADEARTKALQEEQENYLKTKLENIENRKKAAEQALANQKKENELEEQKKKDQIAKMAKENQEEQARLAKQSQLIEEETQKKLAAIALEDEEERQLITKRANEEKAKIEAEMLEKQRKNQEELKKKENELFKQREERQRKIEKMEEEARIMSADARATEELLRQEKAKQADLHSSMQAAHQARMKKGAVDEATQDNQNRALRSVLNYYVNDDEFQQSFQGGSYPSGQYLPQVSEIFSKYPSIRVNISKFFTASGKNKVLAGTNKPWAYYLDSELQKTCSAVGSGWYTKSQLEKRIKSVIGEKF